MLDVCGFNTLMLLLHVNPRYGRRSRGGSASDVCRGEYMFE
ncbi:hypothetical protein Lalb_Chr17g0336621 [Lupinus albus]|uniref:Uncharacterized protein n=1 Tax=Lupinus albus TaxID=3870 RepID=A0A6A4P0W3_LUPAL|nr:hypothetical protein Lalb_Chr17g0336621 [Lupinus albus]